MKQKRKAGRPRGAPSEMVTLRLPRKMLSALDAQAKREGLTRTALIVRALAAGSIVDADARAAMIHAAQILEHHGGEGDLIAASDLRAFAAALPGLNPPRGKRS